MAKSFDIHPSKMFFDERPRHLNEQFFGIGPPVFELLILNLMNFMQSICT